MTKCLGLDGEDVLMGNGISSCALCHGSLYKGQRIVVVGSGDTACEMALFLTQFSYVTIVHRRGEMNASPVVKRRVFSHPKIAIIWNTEIVELIEGVKHHKGEYKSILTGVVIEDLITRQRNEMLVDGLFYGLA